MRYAVLVVAVALLSRIGVVLWLHETVPYSDFALYHAAGVETARHPSFLFAHAGAALLPQINLWPPLYPLFLAGVYALSGPDHRHAVYVQVLLGTLVCWLVFRIVSRALGPRIGCVAGLLMALHPHLVFLTNQLASENLYIVWLALALYLAVRLEADSRAKPLLLMGVVLGLGALTRAIGLVVPIVVLLWWRERAASRRAWVHGALWLLLGTALVLLPWTVRNAIVTGRPALVCSGGGLNFYFGNNPQSIGYRDLAATPLAGLHDPAAIDAKGYALGLRSIATDPLGFIGRGVEKVIALYGFPDYALHVNSGILVPDTRGHPELESVAQATLARQRARDRWLHGPLMVAARVMHLAVLALVAFGIAVGWKRPRLPLIGLCIDLVLVWTAAHILFWAQPRFRHPLEIALVVLAAFALARLPELARRTPTRGLPSGPPGLETPRSNR